MVDNDGGWTAMEAEMSALHNNDTWEVVPLLLDSLLLVAIETLLLNIIWMVLLSGIRHALWSKAIWH